MAVTDQREEAISRPQRSYRRPRRRPAHLRTKTGCLTCRKRKKKCDERRETCANCAQRLLVCTWPSSTVALSTDGVRDDQLFEPAIPPLPDSASVTGPPYEERSRLLSPCHIRCDPSSEIHEVVSSQDVSNSEFGSQNPGYDYQESITLIRTPSILPNYSGLILPASGLLFDFLRTKWLRQLIRPLAAGSLIELYHQESMHMAMSEPFYIHSLLACCGAEYPVDDTGAQEYFQQLGQKHYVRAVSGLREKLESGGSNVFEPSVARTILMLCIFERSKPWPSIGVGAHLLGLARLIQSDPCREISNCPLSSSDAAIRRVTLEAFIFHAATSIPFQPLIDQQSNLEAAIRLAESTLEGTFGDGIPICPDSPVLGTPPKLFVLIREISLLHRRPKRSKSLLDSCRKLHNALDQTEKELSVQYSSESNQGENLRRATMGTETVLISNSDPFLLGPQLYIISANILLADISKLPSTTGRSIPEMVLEGVRLVEQLQPSRDYYAEYYGWPIHVLAQFISCKRARDCLLSQVNAFWKETRSGTMRRLADILRAQEFTHQQPGNRVGREKDTIILSGTPVFPP